MGRHRRLHAIDVLLVLLVLLILTLPVITHRTALESLPHGASTARSSVCQPRHPHHDLQRKNEPLILLRSSQQLPPRRILILSHGASLKLEHQAWLGHRLGSDPNSDAASLAGIPSQSLDYQAPADFGASSKFRSASSACAICAIRPIVRFESARSAIVTAAAVVPSRLANSARSTPNCCMRRSSATAKFTLAFSATYSDEASVTRTHIAQLLASVILNSTLIGATSVSSLLSAVAYSPRRRKPVGKQP